MKNNYNDNPAVEVKNIKYILFHDFSFKESSIPSPLDTIEPQEQQISIFGYDGWFKCLSFIVAKKSKEPKPIVL